MTQDVIYTVPNECGCCQEQGCQYGGGCGCVEDDGTVNAFGYPPGYWCNNCTPTYTTHTCTSSGFYIKCNPSIPGDLISVPCNGHQYTNVKLTIGGFVVGNKNCDLSGEYILTNYGRPAFDFGAGQTACNVAPYPNFTPTGEQVPSCRWVYEGADVQSFIDPITRCTYGPQSCTECSIEGPTSNYTYYRGYGSISFVFSIPNLFGVPPRVDISVGNFMHATQLGGRNCYPCFAVYVLANGAVLKCGGPTDFMRGASNIGGVCNFPNSVTIEMI